VSDKNNAGKISSAFMEKVIYPSLGAKRSEILVGPAAGLDTSVIDLGNDKVLVSSTDPISLIPVLGAEDSAWMSVNLLANDLSTSGLPPQFLLVDLNLPPDLADDTLASYWKSLSEECSRLGIAIAGGNTGKFEGCDLTIVGSGTTLAIGDRRKVISSGGARVGDNVIISKGAAISTTGLLSRIFPNTVRRQLGTDTQEKAQSYFRIISASADSIRASAVGAGSEGITAIHDVAEGGVLSCMLELAGASSKGMSIDEAGIPVSEETKAICSLFEIDPYWSLGEGALVITCNPKVTTSLLRKLEEGGVRASIAGEILPKVEGIFLSQDNKKTSVLRPPSDPYWNAYYSAVAKKWD